MASRPRVVGAAPNVDLRERDPAEARPYEQDADRPRSFVCTCITCGVSERVLFEAGRTRPWEHDAKNASHVIEYRRVGR